MKPARFSLLPLIVLMMLFAAPPGASAADETFSAWLEDLRREASEKGVSASTLEAALGGLRPLPEILDFQGRQPEVELSYAQYRERMISRERIETARRKMDEYGDILNEVSERYGVDTAVLTALWAVESDFGRRAGTYPVLRSLATLAHDGRRQAFFRRELLAALSIVDKGWAKPSDLVGSWAGAMGVFQFIPSTMRHYAVDYDGDGRRNIFENGPDAFASAANYLDKARWRSDEPWGTPVELSEQSAENRADGEKWRTPQEWRQAGVRDAERLACPQARLIRAGENGGPAFLACRNFEALLRWNNSTWFALTIGQLADRIAADEKP